MYIFELAAPICRNALKSLRGNPSMVGNVLRRSLSSLAPKEAGEDAPSSAPAREHEPVLGASRAAQGESARKPEAGRSLPPWLAGKAHATAEQVQSLPGRADGAAAGAAVLHLAADKPPAAEPEDSPAGSKAAVQSAHGQADGPAGSRGAALPGSRAAEGPRPSQDAARNGFRRGSESPRSERSSSSFSSSSSSTAGSSRSPDSRSSADSSPSRHALFTSIVCLSAWLSRCCAADCNTGVQVALGCEHGEATAHMVASE